MSETAIERTERPMIRAMRALREVRAREITAVVREATASQDTGFLEGLQYGLILACLWCTPEIQQAWYAGISDGAGRYCYVKYDRHREATTTGN